MDIIGSLAQFSIAALPVLGGSTHLHTQTERRAPSTEAETRSYVDSRPLL